MTRLRLALWLLLAASSGAFVGYGVSQLSPAALLGGPIDSPNDRWERAETVPTGQPVPCPTDATTIAVAGQSNAANSVGQRFVARQRVYQLYQGKCYPAAGPLAGADGGLGSYWPLVGDLLVERGFAPSIIFVGLAKGSTKAAQWADPAELGGYASRRLKGAGASYIAWHQGESDLGTPVADFRISMQRVIANLQEAAPGARIVLARASVCNSTRSPAPLSEVQASLVDGKWVFAGPNTDTLIAVEDRYDECHFSGVAAVKVAKLWADALVAAR